MPLVLGIDLGTSSVKILILDESGHVHARTTADYPMQSPLPGYVEQKPADWWNGVCSACRAAINVLESNRGTLNASDIAGISLSGQMNGAVFLDNKNLPLGPAILWLDGRSQSECDEANEKAGILLEKHAMTVLNPINTLAKILWYRNHKPDLYSRSKSVLVPKDWLRYKMTGVLCAEESDASVTGAMDIYRRTWSGDIIDGLDIRDDLFPEICKSVDQAGVITREVSAETGLPAGTPVIAGGGDMACMAVGSGAIRPGLVGVGIGTAGHAIAFAEQINEKAFNQLWPMCHCIPGAYFWLGCSYTGGGSLTWFQEQFDDEFEVLFERAEKVPPGSDGLFFMPWLAGAATPHPNARARAGWIGLTLHHTRDHMVRALMEGVAFDLRQSLECFKMLNLPIDEIRLGEGGVRSNLWRNILVNIFGGDGVLMELGDASAAGAAIVAGVGTGVFDSFDTACETCIGLGDVVPHDQALAGLYNDRFDQYTRLYPALKTWFDTMPQHT